MPEQELNQLRLVDRFKKLQAVSIVQVFKTHLPFGPIEHCT